VYGWGGGVGWGGVTVGEMGARERLSNSKIAKVTGKETTVGGTGRWRQGPSLRAVLNRVVQRATVVCARAADDRGGAGRAGSVGRVWCLAGSRFRWRSQGTPWRLPAAEGRKG
jgi:hypothetical protein